MKLKRMVLFCGFIMFFVFEKLLINVTVIDGVS